MIRLIITFLSCLICISCLGQTKKELRKIAKKMRKGEIYISQNADTVYIRKEVIKEVVKVDTVQVENIIISYRDTCEKSRAELRNKRLLKKYRFDNDIKTLKIQLARQKEINKKDVRLASIEKDKLLDSLDKATKILIEKNKALKDSLKQAVKINRIDSRVEKITSKSWVFFWDWFFAICLMLVCFVIGRLYSKTIGLLFR